MSVKTSFSGPRVVAFTSGAMALLFLGRLVIGGAGEEGIRAVVRASAQTSLLFLCAAFAASSLRQLWPSPATRWMLANRRYLGISMGISHAIHLAALIALGSVSTSFREELNIVTIIFGGLGFVICFAMALTSSNAAVAWLGATNWSRLHKFGIYYLWFIFFQSYVPRMLMASPLYAIPVTVLVAAMAVRVMAYRQKRAPVARAVGLRPEA